MQLTAAATNTTHVVLASCPECHFGEVSAACEGNRNIHMSFARSGDINDLWLQPEPEPADDPAEQAAADAQMAEKGYHTHFALQAPPVAIGDSSKETHIICDAIFVLKTIVFPRQARDKHSES